MTIFVKKTKILKVIFKFLTETQSCPIIFFASKGISDGLKQNLTLWDKNFWWDLGGSEVTESSGDVTPTFFERDQSSFGLTVPLVRGTDSHLTNI